MFIPISKPSITDLEISMVCDAVKSGWVSSIGDYITKFESEYAKFCNTKYALTVSNGTVGLHLALVSLGVKPGDEVIIPDLTFIATANAVRYIGATPVLVDINEKSLCIDPDKILHEITPKTKAIIPVHLYGQPADMEKINTIAKDNSLIVVEDAAEAHGAKVGNKIVGSLGDCGVFSFYGNKIITTGEGGIITTNDEKLYERMRFLRDHAMSRDKKFWHAEIGYNYRMTNMQAALGYAQMKRVNDILEKKYDIYSWYKEYLFDNSRIILNDPLPSTTSVFWMIGVQIIGLEEKDRDQLLITLNKKGIDTRPFFYPVSDMMNNHFADTPITHLVSKRGFNLPSYYDITRDQVKFICSTLVELLD